METVKVAEVSLITVREAILAVGIVANSVNTNGKVAVWKSVPVIVNCKKLNVLV